MILNSGATGCILFANIKKANANEYKRTQNDDNYSDVVSMIATPLNIYGNNGKKMIGILHITAPKSGVFNQDDVEFAKMMADLAAIGNRKQNFRTNKP